MLSDELQMRDRKCLCRMQAVYGNQCECRRGSHGLVYNQVSRGTTIYNWHNFGLATLMTLDWASDAV